MLTAFKLAQAINESATSAPQVDNVNAHEFVGTIAEAAAEFNYVVMCETTDIVSFHTAAEEIMAEAAMTNPASLETITENVFTTIGQKMKSFIDKIIAMVKGMIEKIKAFFAKLSGKTDKWLTIMKPKITAAQGKSGYGDATFEMRKWDDKYVTGGMISGINELVNVTDKNADGSFSAIDEVKRHIDGLKLDMTSDNQGKNADDPAISAAVDKLTKHVEALKEMEGNATEEFVGEVAKCMDVTGDGPNTIEDVWSAVTKKATGGEKVTMKYSEYGIDRMIKGVENSKKCISDLKKAYEKHLTALTKLKGKIESTFKADSKVEKLDKFPSDLKAKYQAAVSATSSAWTKSVSAYESVVNTAKSKNIELVQAMTSDYMSALSKLAGYKGKKDDEV